MATLLEGESELVLPAVPGFFWSHLGEKKHSFNEEGGKKFVTSDH